MEEIFNQERVISFVKLWRNIAAGIVGAFLVLYGVSSFLLSNQPALTGDQGSLISDQTQRELSALSNKVSKFNSLVSAVSEVKGEDEDVVVTFLNDMDNIMSEFGITPDRMRIDRGDTSVTLEARAGDYGTVIEFKDALVASGKFSGVNLPLSDVTEQGSAEVGFRINFQYNFGG